MDITIIGTGNMARGIGTRVLAGGHSLTLVGRTGDQAQAVAEELPGNAHAASLDDRLDGDIVVLAVPYAALEDVLERYRDQLAGKVVVDISNPVDFATFTPEPVDGSAAEEIGGTIPRARVVKAFNTTFADTLVEGQVAGRPLDVLIAADDEGAKATVTRLVEDGGLRAVDAGPLARAHELEALGYLHISVQNSLHIGFGSTVKLVA
jgi:8-hydroxy-5-deazaflavin:NADPH oxidoreductase